MMSQIIEIVTSLKNNKKVFCLPHNQFMINRYYKVEEF